MIERKFISKGIRNAELNEYLDSVLDRADYSHSDIKRTPLNTRITVFAGRPGMVIGRGGTKIKEITETMATRFSIDNPQLEVKSVENPDLDPKVVAKQIVAALEKGMKHRRIVNVMIKRIMNSGAVGVEITVSGKVGGGRGRSEKFLQGYIKKCGDTADKHTLKGFASASLRQGSIGVRVKIMKELPSMILFEKQLKEEALKPEDEKPEAEAPAEEAAEPSDVEAAEEKSAETEEKKPEEKKAKKSPAKKSKSAEKDDAPEAEPKKKATKKKKSEEEE